MNDGVNDGAPDDGERRAQHRHVRAAFLDACSRPAEERAEFLARACAGDDGLRREVEALLAFDEQQDGLLEIPALGADFVIPRPEAITRPARQSGAGPPANIGRYAIRGVLGRGAMSTVYRAEQAHTHREVALKVLDADVGRPRVLERFEFEAEVLGLLEHPGIARIHEAGTVDVGAGRQAFFAMELVEGPTIREWAERKSLGLPQRLALVAAVADALHHAHQRGVVHRDLKPDNVLVDASGQPKILDFGVARVVGEGARRPRGDAARLVGTPAYMSPEQVAKDPGSVDTRSDVYSLGVIAYELVSGELPYPVAGASLAEIAERICFDEPRPLGLLRRELRGNVTAIVARAMQKDRELRYASAADLAADIRRTLAHEPVAARRAGVAHLAACFARRNRALCVAIAGLFLALVGGLTASSALAVRARRESERALALTELLLGLLGAPTAQPGAGFDVTVLDVLERSEDEMRARLADWPELQARLALTLGILYGKVGKFDRAERNLEEALDLYRRETGERSALGREAARELLNVRVFHDDDPRRCEALLARALELDAAESGLDSGEFLQTRFLLGIHQRRVGDLEAAIATLGEVEAAAEHTPDVPPEFPAQARNFLARALNEGGRRAEALALMERTLADQLASTGEANRVTLISMVSLAEVLLAANDVAPDPAGLQRARDLLTRAVAGRSKVLGLDHPGTLTARQLLAVSRFRQGEREEALAELEDVVARFDALRLTERPEAREARECMLELRRIAGRGGAASGAPERR